MDKSKQIHSFVHCARCIVDRRVPDIEAGMTQFGIQIWCRVHDMEIVHVTPAALMAMIQRGPVCEDPDHKG